MMMTKGNEKKTKAVYKYHITKLGEGETIPAKNGVSRRAKQPELLFPKKKKNKGKKYSKYTQKKADEIFSLYIRTRDGKCLKCGKTTSLQCAHIKGRRNRRLRYDPMNAITLCYGCHMHWAHTEPIEFVEWLKSEQSEKYYYVVDHQNEVEKVDYEETIGILSNLLKRYNADS